MSRTLFASSFRFALPDGPTGRVQFLAFERKHQKKRVTIKPRRATVFLIPFDSRERTATTLRRPALKLPFSYNRAAHGPLRGHGRNISNTPRPAVGSVVDEHRFLLFGSQKFKQKRRRVFFPAPFFYILSPVSFRHSSQLFRSKR